MLNKPTPKPEQPLEEYIQGRINAAAEKGFNSTLVWVRPENAANAERILKNSGFKMSVFKEEPTGKKQYEVRWD